MDKISHLTSYSIIALLLILTAPSVVKSQSSQIQGNIPDSVMEKKHSPTKATIMSAVIPGLGQIYNRKYWKVPVIYAGFGIMTYFIVTNVNDYLDYKCAYIEKMNGDTTGNYSDLVNKYSSESLLSAREYYRRNTEISILITAIWYILNIVDAAVDAHLFSYNISKDLTIKFEPALFSPLQGTSRVSGLRVSLNF
jgi:hypothetical protein